MNVIYQLFDICKQQLVNIVMPCHKLYLIVSDQLSPIVSCLHSVYAAFTW